MPDRSRFTPLLSSPTNIVLFGPPGAGKGTQGVLLAQRTGLPKVATGDVLRAAVREETALGREAQGYMDQGLLVPDEIIVALLEELLASPQATRGIIMDGFPRTVVQARAVDTALAERGQAVDLVLRLEVPEPELIRRLAGRAAEQGRTDDTVEAIQRRLAVYREETAPVLAHYAARDVVREIDGTGAVEEIAERVNGALGT